MRFIEPFPQFTEMLLKPGEQISWNFYKDRKKENDIFIESLRKYSLENNLMSPISQKEILESIGVEELTTDMTPNYAPHPIDGLKPEYNEKIYNLFVTSIKEMITRQ